MPTSFGHTNGINLTNYRTLSGKRTEMRNGFRPTAEWTMETLDQIGAGATENKMSSTLRNASQQLQDATYRMVSGDMAYVDRALRTKLGQTESLKGMLEQTLEDVMSEIAELASLKARLNDRLNKVGSKINLNQDRLSVRTTRPPREKTMDEVERTLLHQGGMLSGFEEKVRRAISQIDREMGMLESIKNKLEADLRDKVDAVKVDETVLRIPSEADVVGTLSSSYRKNHDCANKTPHAWVRNTEDNLRNAQHWIKDSQRLRKAIRYAVQSSRDVEHAMASKLNENMMQKLNATRSLKGDLEYQLEKVREETARALSERSALAAAIEAKRGPLAQAKERLAVRKARPCRETVTDEVEIALAREIANLSGATASLTDKLHAVDKEIAQLDSHAAQLEDNIRDKDTALNTDERMVMLDGRIHLPTAPPTSVASFAVSALSTARTATLNRIRDLEGTLATARRERETMESSIRQLRDSLGSPKAYA